MPMGPVFDTKVVEEGLGGIGHTDVFGSGLGTGGQFSGSDFSITVSVAEVPEWLPVGVWDLNLTLASVLGVVSSVLIKRGVVLTLSAAEANCCQLVWAKLNTF